MERIEVVSPVGGEFIRQTTIAPRLHDLAGKTVCETWNGLFKGDFTFPVIRKLLQEKCPEVKVIPYTEFPFLHGGDNPTYQAELAKKIAVLAKEKGCDALISGNGA
jgi:hypothetical protein